ncbi:MAG: ABC transporter permease [Nitrospirae bacterium]|nr:ABC transporter permease [Nitrospirota bacterium]
MLLWKIIQTALRGIIANKMRSFLTMLGIIIGVAAIIAMISIGEGAKKQVTESIQSFGTNLLRVSPGAARMGHVRTGAVETLTIEDAEAINKDVPHILHVATQVRNMAQIKYGNNNSSTSITGTVPQFTIVNNFSVATGRFIDEKDVKLMKKTAVLGATVKKNLFGEGLAIGNYIKIKGVNFLVTGVMATKGQTSWHDPDDQIFIPITTSQKRMFRQDYVDSIYIQVEGQEYIQDVKETAEKLLMRRHRISGTADADFNVRDYTEFIATLQETTRTFTILLGSIAAVSLLVGGIGVMNIMLVSVTERTREIGIRMAVGARRRDILLQFLIEALVISVMGGISGVALGILISYGVSSFGTWDTIITPTSVLLAFFFSVLIGIIFGLYPARKASLMEPIEALRYE